MNTIENYKSFTAFVDTKGRYQKFEICLGVDISESVYDIVEFLKEKQIKGEFVLRVNGKKIVLSKDSNPALLMNEFFGRSEAQAQNIL